MKQVIAYVVRNATGEVQLSTRFTVLQHARTFADQCAEPVRVWRIVRKANGPAPWFEICQHLDCEETATWRVVDAQGRVVRGTYNCDEHRPPEPPRAEGEKYEHQPHHASRAALGKREGGGST